MKKQNKNYYYGEKKINTEERNNVQKKLQ